MKNLLKFFALAVVILGFSATSFGQTNTVSDATAKAKIIKALTIQNPTSLNFGTVGALSTAVSNVVLATDGTRGASTADLVGTDGIAGVFNVSGEGNSAVTVTLPAADVTVSPSDGGTGADMTISSGSWTTNLGADLSNVTLDNTGAKTFKVGATLNVGINQASGTYQGTYAVTVNYN